MGKVVYIVLKGRLGNNMYQYAYALSLHQRGYDVVCVYGNPDPKHYLDPYVLDKNVKIISYTEFTKRAQPGCVRLYNEDPVWIPVLPPPMYLKSDVIIDTYFQSEFFFGNVVNEVQNAYTLKEDVEQNNKFHVILGKNSCAITVRLTDYLTNNLYTPLDVEYYKRAISRIQETTYDSDLIFFNVFSDDIKLAEQKLSPLKQLLGDQINFIDSPNPYHTIELLKLHQHSILSNSTFAWWGAYLNEKNGKVVYPRDWFTHRYASQCYQVKGWMPV